MEKNSFPKPSGKSSQRIRIPMYICVLDGSQKIEWSSIEGKMKMQIRLLLYPCLGQLYQATLKHHNVVRVASTTWAQNNISSSGLSWLYDRSYNPQSSKKILAVVAQAI